MPKRLLILTGVLAVFVICGVSLAVAETVGLFGGHAQSQRNRQAALRDASRLLSRLQLPPGVVLQRVVPRSKLSELQGARNHADAADRWTAPGSMHSVLSYVATHQPLGSKVVGGGYSTGPGHRVTSRSISFGWPSVSDELTGRELDVSVSPDGRSRVKIFAQAESIWLTARPDSERIPTQTRTIEIVVGHAHHVLRAITVRRLAKVKGIVAAFNNVPIVQPDFYGCPLTLRRLERSFFYTFRGARGRVLARARYEISAGSSPGPCNSIAVTIWEHRQPDLLGGAPIVAVQRSLGIKTVG